MEAAGKDGQRGGETRRRALGGDGRVSGAVRRKWRGLKGGMGMEIREEKCSHIVMSPREK